VFGAALALERNPDAARAIAAAGHEVCSHGWRWVGFQDMDDRGRARADEARDRVDHATIGTRPLGWYCRYAPSINTRKLVVEEGGFLYDSDDYNDDLPYWTCASASKPHLVIPYTLDANDMKFSVPPGFSSGDGFFNYLKDAFDVLYAEGKTTPKMMSVGLHTRLAGRPGRAKSLARFLDYVLEKKRRLDHAARRHRAPLDRASSGGEVSLNARRNVAARRALARTRHVRRDADAASTGGCSRKPMPVRGAVRDVGARARIFIVEQDRRRQRVRAARGPARRRVDPERFASRYRADRRRLRRRLRRVAALCALEALDEDGIETEHPIEAVAWAGEEGQPLSARLFGQRRVRRTERSPTSTRLVDEDGTSFFGARKAPNGLAAGRAGARQFSGAAGYVELHIEQGPVLEHEHKRSAS
jgi:peptidoglycan/xylan/chitin deacetylase (PgdA/CDA1 family)